MRSEIILNEFYFISIGIMVRIVGPNLL
jgi:hypothetical protein